MFEDKFEEIYQNELVNARFLCNEWHNVILGQNRHPIELLKCVQ